MENHYFRFKNNAMWRPWWSRGWEAQYRGHGFDPWSRGIPHGMKQLSPCSAITGAYVSSRPCSATTGPTATRSPHMATREQPLLATTREKPSRSNEEPLHCNQDPAQPDNNDNESGKRGFTGNVIQSMLVIILVIIKLVKSSKDLL